MNRRKDRTDTWYDICTWNPYSSSFLSFGGKTFLGLVSTNSIWQTEKTENKRGQQLFRFLESMAGSEKAKCRESLGLATESTCF
jgi:hypothetical protein